MKGLMKRDDDYKDRRQHLKDLSDAELKVRFWELAEKVVDPLLDLAKTHTSPSVERSVLLRMGFSSLEAKPLVEQAIDHGLMGKGVGHVIYRMAKEQERDIREVGLEMIDGKHWSAAVKLFKGGPSA